MRSLRRFIVANTHVLTGGLLAAATAAATLAGGGWAAFIVLAAAGIVVVSARLVAQPEQRAFVASVALAAFGARAVFAMLLDLFLLNTGHIYRNLFSDDAGYVLIAGEIADKWRFGMPVSGIDPSLDHNYVTLAAGLFYLIGENPAALKLLNTAFGVLAGVLVYRTMVTLALPGARTALVAMLVFPSLVLWSALALKDAFTLFFAMLVISAVASFIRTREFRWHVVAAVSLLLLANVRAYLFVFLTALWPLAVCLAARGHRRWRGTALATVISVLLLLTYFPFPYIPGLATFNFTRAAMAMGARSGFVEPYPAFQAEPGQGFTVGVPAGASPPPSRFDSCYFIVPPGTQIIISLDILDRPACPEAIIVPFGTSVVVVRPGDIVVIGRRPGPPGAPTPSPLPTLAATPGVVVLDPQVKNVVATPAPSAATPDDRVSLPPGLVENLLHLPVGVAFVLGAPFPFTWRSMSEAATVPETLLWYPTVVFAAFGIVWAVRSRRWDLAYPIGVAGLIFLLFSLIEGNTGTLVRHRSMLIPYAVMLAAVGASWRLGWDAEVASQVNGRGSGAQRSGA